MALVAQEGMGDFPFTVLDVVLMGRAPYLKGFALEGKGDMEKAMWAIDVTDLSKLYKRNIQELSGGERQRAFIARALAQDTTLLFLDEPTAFLDIRHQISLLRLVRELNREYEKTIISVTHDINLASYFYDRIVLLSRGEVFASGTPEEVITEANMREVYDAEITVDTNPVFKRPRITISGGLMK
jgi:iron complex transport system ATP-binding protein